MAFVIAAVVLCCAVTAFAGQGPLTFEETAKYTIYVGTNDKDTLKSEISLKEAKELVAGICNRYVGGYTLYQANGGWLNADGEATQEDTLVLVLFDAAEQDVKNIAGEITAALNQESLLIEKDTAAVSFYGG